MTNQEHMKLQCFTINKQHFIEPLPAARPTAAWRQGEMVRWLDVEISEHEALRPLLASLDLDPAIFDYCIDPARSPHIATIGGTICCRVPQPARDRPSSEYISLICLQKLLITVHSTPTPWIDQALHNAAHKNPSPAATVLAFVEWIMAQSFGVDLASFFDLRVQADKLASSIDEMPDDIEIDAIVTMNRQIAALINNCEDLLITCSFFWNQETSVKGEMESTFQIDFNGLERMRTLYARLESRLQALHQQYQLTLQKMTNNRLRILTVLSAVFLPLTLIAGIYGMNFRHMPELDQPYAYFMVLFLMIGVGGAMILFFYIKGWFK